MSPCVELSVGEMRRCRPLLGTFVEITVRGADASLLQDAIDSAFAGISQVQRLMSFHDANSDISLLNSAKVGKNVALHPWTASVLRRARQLSGQSEGLFDITVASKLVAAGFLPARSDSPQNGGRWHDLRENSDGSWTKHRPLQIDLGGIAKGFAVDQAVAILKKTGIVSGLVNAGGDLRAFGPEVWKVGIRDAGNLKNLVATMQLQNAAVATSGGCRAIAAILHGQTRRPAFAGCSVSVFAPTALWADALTKIAMLSPSAAKPFLRRYRAKAFWQTGRQASPATPAAQAA